MHAYRACSGRLLDTLSGEAFDTKLNLLQVVPYKKCLVNFDFYFGGWGMENK